MAKFELLDREKFAIIGVENVATDIDENWEGQLPDETWVLNKIPVDIESRWQEWLGSIRVEHLKRSSLVLARKTASANPEILDETHEQLSNHLSHLFSILQLSGVLEYEDCHVLAGSVIYGKPEIRQVSRLPNFYRTRGYVSPPVNLRRLEEAAKLKSVLPEIYSTSGDFRRVARGLNVLIDGLKQNRAEERLHQFVRSLEALILPDIGRTKSQFVHRCQTFAKASAKSVAILEEAFDLRSQAEHLNDWEVVLASHPAKRREYLAFQRTWKMERLACFAYSRILGDAAIQAHFKTETTIHNFWKQQERSRIAIWGKQFNL